MTTVYLQQFYKDFPKFLPLLPYHQYLVQSFFTGDLNTLPNLLLYGQKGFPHDLLIEYALSEYFHCEFPIQKRYPLWNDTMPYIETNYYFCIDTEHPHFPKDPNVLIDFIINIVQSRSVYLERHIIVLKNIDQIANKHSSYIFRSLLERFSQNVLFITMTHNLQMVEPPLRSRMQLYRVPLPTIAQNEAIMMQVCPPMKKIYTRNLMLLLFGGADAEVAGGTGVPLLNYPPLMEYVTHTPLNATNIRALSYKLFQYQISVGDLAKDCLHLIPTDTMKMQWVAESAMIEHSHKNSDPVKQCYYLELLLHCFRKYIVA